MYFLLGDQMAYLLGAILVIASILLFKSKVSLQLNKTGGTNPA
jgi:hypothetical protein